MNQTFLCLFVILTFAYSLNGQTIVEETQDFWETPVVVDDLVEPLASGDKSIKAIKAREYRVFPSGAEKDNGTGDFFEFDSLGHLVKQVEIERHDTSHVRDFYYTKSGFLSWAIYHDKEWDKKYKAGFRQNRDSTVFQVKSYEMLQNDASMLLDTRQYTYTASGDPAAVMYLENNDIIQTRFFKYNENRKLTEERLVDGDNDELWSIAYEYNATGRLVNVRRTKMTTSENIEEYQIVYNKAGDIKETRWLINDLLKVQGTYNYDAEGRLEKIYKDLLSDSGQQHFVKVYEYQFY